ncbi:hypothetical protein EVAR_30374_1 [Eumeta japonica]|uniref:Uncharacterized protein n=1 Tax=Eumeta variegata TaxID=151549 RepID=A0A4C1W7X4_EUMVA|nr:hypothetical protein EVAR_30374_1 [Eumeta japonica]
MEKVKRISKHERAFNGLIAVDIVRSEFTDVLNKRRRLYIVNKGWLSAKRHGRRTDFEAGGAPGCKEAAAKYTIATITLQVHIAFYFLIDNCLPNLKECACGLRIDELSVKCLLNADHQVTLAPAAVGCGLQEMKCKLTLTPEGHTTHAVLTPERQIRKSSPTRKLVPEVKRYITCNERELVLAVNYGTSNILSGEIYRVIPPPIAVRVLQMVVNTRWRRADVYDRRFRKRQQIQCCHLRNIYCIARPGNISELPWRDSRRPPAPAGHATRLFTNAFLMNGLPPSARAAGRGAVAGERGRERPRRGRELTSP